MKENELMIGDWVQVKDCIDQSYYFDEYEPGEIVQVREVLDNGINPNWAGAEVSSILGLEDIQPIPLTPEILEKNGLTLSLYGEHFPEDKRYDLEISVIEGDIYWTIECGYYGILRLRFVHELQHCLKLVGIKKEIQI